MSTWTTIQIDTRHEYADERTIAQTLELGGHRAASGARPARGPNIGAVALDAMAAIAGPSWAPGYERAWDLAASIVTEAMFAVAAGEAPAAVA
jgi:hypothetical protein